MAATTPATTPGARPTFSPAPGRSLRTLAIPRAPGYRLTPAPQPVADDPPIPFRPGDRHRQAQAPATPGREACRPRLHGRPASLPGRRNTGARNGVRDYAHSTASARAVRRLGGARAPGTGGVAIRNIMRKGARERETRPTLQAASHNVFLWPLAGIPASSPASTRTTCAANRRHHSALNQTPPAPQVRTAPAPREYTLPLGCRRTALGGGNQRCAQAHPSRPAPLAPFAPRRRGAGALPGQRRAAFARGSACPGRRGSFPAADTASPSCTARVSQPPLPFPPDLSYSDLGRFFS